MNIETLTTLRRFVSADQISAIQAGIRGEEGQYFRGLALLLATTFMAMPRTYEQDGLGDQAIVHLHYFTGSQDWYITERDVEPMQHQTFGLADLFMDGGELGYISIVELIQNGVEIDFHWTPRTLADVRTSRASGRVAA